MALKPETVLKNRIMPLLKQLPKGWFEKIQQKAIRGTPDILGCLRGTFIAIELKSDVKAHIDELQRYKLDRIDRADGLALVIYPGNWDYWYAKLLKFSKGETDEL